MSTIRFNRGIYLPDAVSEGVAVFAEYGDLRIDDSDSEYIDVHVGASDAERERALEGAFANYVLGVTVHSDQEGVG